MIDRDRRFDRASRPFRGNAAGANPCVFTPRELGESSDLSAKSAESSFGSLVEWRFRRIALNEEAFHGERGIRRQLRGRLSTRTNELCPRLLTSHGEGSILEQVRDIRSERRLEGRRGGTGVTGICANGRRLN